MPARRDRLPECDCGDIRWQRSESLATRIAGRTRQNRERTRSAARCLPEADRDPECLAVSKRVRSWWVPRRRRCTRSTAEPDSRLQAREVSAYAKLLVAKRGSIPAVARRSLARARDAISPRAPSLFPWATSTAVNSLPPSPDCNNPLWSPRACERCRQKRFQGARGEASVPAQSIGGGSGSAAALPRRIKVKVPSIAESIGAKGDPHRAAIEVVRRDRSGAPGLRELHTLPSSVTWLSIGEL